MDNLLNNPVMIKLQEFGQVLGRNKFLSALQGSMMALMGVIMVGAISQILCAVGCESMLGLFATGDTVYNAIALPQQFTTNMLALWIVGLIAYDYARSLELKSPVVSMVECLAVFLLIASPIGVNEAGANVIDITFLGPQGMFIGFMVCLICIRIDKLCLDRNIYIRMPDGVPPFLQDGFAAIVPLLINVVLAQVASVAVLAATGGAFTLCTGFMAILAYPLSGLMSIPGMFVLGALAGLLWCFGIHGSAIILPIVFSAMIPAIVQNGMLVANGQAPEFNPAFLYTPAAVAGGTGNTLALVIMGLRSKSEQIRAVSRASIIPGWFKINEPVAFGMPIMYNPVLCIPYVLCILCGQLFFLIGYTSGIITPPWISVIGLMPMGFQGFLMTLNPMNAIWDYLLIIPTALIWFPFFKVYEKQLVAKEEEARKLEESEASAA